MCVGIPMQVLEESGDNYAVCKDYIGDIKEVDIQLVGKQGVGTWLKVFIDSAREVITAEEAQKAANALKAVEIAMSGGERQNIDNLFEDLVNRKPVNPFEKKMFEELIQNLITQKGYKLVREDNLDEFLNTNEYTVLFFANDANLYPESLDVAVVLPELLKVFDNLVAGVVSRDFEKKMQGRYGFSAWPCLVFNKNGGYLGAISKIKDWEEYISEIQNILNSEVKRPPTRIQD